MLEDSQACLDRSPVTKENIPRLHGIWRKPYKLIHRMFMNDMGWTMCFASLFITGVCNTASVGVCAQMICHFCLCPNAFISRALLDFPFFTSFFLGEAAWSCQGRVLIKTWGGEWHLESDGWKGIKFSLEPTVWNWYRPLPPVPALSSQADDCINIFKWEVKLHLDTIFASSEQNRMSKLSD